MSMTGLTGYWESLSKLFLETAVTNSFGKEIGLDDGARSVVKMILTAYHYDYKVMIVGNGGSAAIAGHMHNDLCKAVGVRAMVFDNVSLLTALTNDHGYEYAYERPVKMWAEDGDVLVAISSSGESENILRAVRMAKQCGCKVVTLSGFDRENSLRHLGDFNFHVPVADYGLVESAHAVLAHFFTDNAAALAREEGAANEHTFRLLKAAVQ